jgi:hypothetical protein
LAPNRERLNASLAQLSFSYRRHHQLRSRFAGVFNCAVKVIAVALHFPIAQTNISAQLVRN